MNTVLGGVLLAITVTALLAAGQPLRASPRAGFDLPSAEAAAGRAQLVVDRLRERLGIGELVRVSVLPSVSLVVSVEAPKGSEAAYVLRIEQTFLEELSPTELEAALAHELGHVWVFTHHPFLQTEPLANQIARRIVPRESLAGVYRKLWARGGTEGDMDALLGPP